MRPLPPRIREAVIRDLCWYRQAREDLAEAAHDIGDVLQPTRASMSYIGATTGQPGNPTLTRAMRLHLLRARAEDAARVVSAVDGWMHSMRRDERVMVTLAYALERDDPTRDLMDSARAAGIPCATSLERRWVRQHHEALLWGAARALGYRVTRSRGRVTAARRGRLTAGERLMEEMSGCAR